MHFGYYLWPANPLALEPMLEETSRQVFRRLDLTAGMNVLDLGCGLGAPARTLIAEHAVVVTAVTIVEWQIAKARALSEATTTARPGRVEWRLGDYTALDCRGTPTRPLSPSRPPATPPARAKSPSSGSARDCCSRGRSWCSPTAS